MTRVARMASALAAWLALAGAAPAQTLPTAVARSFNEMKAVVPHAETGASQRVQLQWFATNVPERAVARAEDARVVSRVRGEGPLPREHDPQLSTDRLVVVSSDAAGREVDWRIVLDPRLIRAEVADDQGRLTGSLLQRVEANLLVDIPDSPDIVRLRVYQPEWSGGGFVLRLIATADLR